MRVFTGLALTALAIVPAAAGDHMPLFIENASSLTIEAFNTFPIDAEGVPIEDNIGSMLEHLPPGKRTSLSLLMAECGPVHIAAVLSNGSETYATIDMCKQRSVVLRD